MQHKMETRVKYFSSILSSCIGNIVEWYDFGLFTIFSTLFSHVFFPTQDTRVAIIATFGVFAIGFICRPIGALIFGYLGDRIGRAKTLRLSILMIAIPTLLIAFLPTYAQAGIFAPLLLILTRMWQGVSLGGEYSGNLIYLAEVAPRDHRALITALASMGANIGILLAAVMGIMASAIFSEQELLTWAWRVPYLISGVFSLLIYLTRLKIRETEVFHYLQNKKIIAKNPIKLMLQHNIPEILRTLGLVCMGTAFYYFCYVFIPVYLESDRAYSIHHVSFLMSVSLALMILLVPMGAYICDRIGRRKMLLFNSALVMCIVIPGFYYLRTDAYLYVVLLLFTMASASEQGATSVAVVENFPSKARYTGISLSYNLGNGFIGGTVPIICEWLLTKVDNPLAPACYIALCAAVTLSVVYFFVPETRGISLKH